MHVVVIRHLFALFLSVLLSIYLVPIVILAAKKIGFMDAPDGRLKHQKEPVAYLGGVAIFIPFIATLGLCYPFENNQLWFLLGITLLLFVGLIDDLKVLKPSQKFFGQFLAVLCFLKGGFSLKTTFLSSALTIFWSSFWMLSVINAYNLVDVMDGLCATLAISSATVFCLLAWLAGKYSISLLLITFIGSTIGFLWYNKPPAKIYLGDAGSLLIGGFIAAVPFMFEWDRALFAGTSFLLPTSIVDLLVRPLLEVFLIPALIIAVPLMEVVGLFVIRASLGLPFYNGSPHHFSIYLQKQGLKKEQILLFSIAISFVMACGVFLFLNRFISLTALLGWASAGVAVWIYCVFFRKARAPRIVNS